VIAGRSRRPFYARLLRLRYLHPGGLACFLLFEGTIALGLLLAFAELVDWPVVILLPAGVAVMVKLNDILAGATLSRGARVARGTAVVVDTQPARKVVGKAPGPTAPQEHAPDGTSPTA
jgi:hypothetical protein